jgi:hypothetical protein
VIARRSSASSDWWRRQKTHIEFISVILKACDPVNDTGRIVERFVAAPKKFFEERAENELLRAQFWRARWSPI